MCKGLHIVRSVDGNATKLVIPPTLIGKALAIHLMRVIFIAYTCNREVVNPRDTFHSYDEDSSGNYYQFMMSALDSYVDTLLNG